MKRFMPNISLSDPKKFIQKYVKDEKRKQAFIANLKPRRRKTKKLRIKSQ